MAMLMLSVSGCRGVVGQTLTPEVAARFAGCFGGVLRNRAGSAWRVRVVLGRDGRRGSDAIHAAAVAGLLGSGCDVVDAGVAMTPTVAVATDAAAREPQGSDELVAGMVITASHNPQQWNGLKCLLREPAGLHGAGACAPPASIANEVIARFRAGTPAQAAWNELGALTRDHEAGETHVDHVMHALERSGMCTMPSKLGEGLRVAIDCVNASASVTGPEFLRSLGCEVVELNTQRSGEQAGLFPHPPEPTLENLTLPGGLCDAVRGHGCAVGFAVDPDADRLALIDEQGRYVGEEYTLALSALAVLDGGALDTSTGEQPVLVTNLSTSRMLNDVAARRGARVLRTPVGEANVVEVMKREGAVLGGEGNGGTIWPRSCYVRDSLASMALTIWLLRGGRDGLRTRGPATTLSRLVAGIPSYAIVKRKVDLASKEQAGAAIEATARHFAALGNRVDRSDGAWVDFTQGPLAGKAWLHVRASNTEPIMRLIAEAPTDAQARDVLAEAQKAIDARG